MLKKIILAVAILSIGYSCSKDKEDEYPITQEELLGEWELVKASGELHTSWIDTLAPYDLSDCNTLGRMEIKDNGEYTYILPEHIYDVCNFKSRVFNYGVNNGKVNVENPGGFFTDYHHSFKMKNANMLQYKVEIIEQGKLVVKNVYTMERF